MPIIRPPKLARAPRLAAAGAWIVAATLVLLPLSAEPAPPADGPQLSAPVLGYVFDATGKSIREVSGVPGAASVDGPLDLGVSLNTAWVHSGARAAIAVNKDGQVVVAGWTGEPSLTATATSLAEVTNVAWSRSGSVAALSGGTGIEVWSATGQLQASYHPTGTVTALAIGNDGSVAAATEAGSIVLLRDGNQAVVASGGEWTALAFSANGDDLIASEASNQQLIVIRDVASNPGRTILAGLDATPGALAVAGTGGSVAVVTGDDPANQDLAVVTASGEVTAIACGCAAAGLNALAGNLVVQLTGTSDGALLLLDADAETPRLIAVPLQAPLQSTNGGSAE